MESMLFRRSLRLWCCAVLAAAGLMSSTAVLAQTSGASCTRPPTDPELAALARSLNYDLSRIYEYIYYNVDYSPSYGLKKGALATFLDRRGNNLDQNVLFVELLKQSCIDATFKFGAVPIPTAGVANWLGVPNDVTSVTNVLGYGGTSANVAADFTTVATWWTEVQLNGTTYELDPSFKSHLIHPSADVPTMMGYSHAQTVSAALSGASSVPSLPGGIESIRGLSKTQLAGQLNSYAGNLLQAIRSQRPDDAAKAVFGGKDITDDSFGALFPSGGTSYPTIPASVETVFTVSVSDHADGSNPSLTKVVYASQVSARSLILRYDNGIPSLTLDGASLGSGASTTQPAQMLTLSVQHPYPNAQRGANTVRTMVSTNGRFAVMLAAGEMGRDQLTRHQVAASRLSQQSGNDDAALNESLTAIGAAYLTQTNIASAFVGNYFGFVDINHEAMGVAGKVSSAYVDFPALRHGLAPADVGKTDADANAPFAAMGLISSALESTAVTQLQNNPSVSTVRMFDIANTHGTGFVRATASNWAQIVPLLTNWAPSDLAIMASKLQAHPGTAWVIVPLNGKETVNSWDGSGYFTWWSADGELETGYYISGGYGGGYGTISDYWTTLTWLNSFAASNQNFAQPPLSFDPINMVTGAFTYEHPDISVGSGDYPFSLALTRYYDSGRAAEDVGMGNGWRHNFQMSATVDSDSYEAFGSSSPSSLVSLAVTTQAVADLMSAPIPTTGEAVSANLTASWLMDQLVDNAVTVSIGTGTKKFIRVPTAAGPTYVPPPGDASSVTLAADRSAVLLDKFRNVYEFGSNGKINRWRDPNGNQVTFNYSAPSGGSSQLQSVVGPAGTLTFAYAGDHLSTVKNTNWTVGYGYSGSLLASYTDGRSATTNYTYDAGKRLRSIFYPEFPTQPSVVNVYDDSGKVATQTDGAGNQWTYQFANGFLSQEIDPTGANRQQYFTAMGGLRTEINQLGFRTTSTYDGLGRVLTTTYPAGNSVVLVYDAASNVTRRTTYPVPGAIDLLTGEPPEPRVEQWTYDLTDSRVTSETNALGQVTDKTYDAYGNLLSVLQPAVTGPDGTLVRPLTSYTHNARGQVVDTIDPAGRVTRNAWDNIGRLASVTEDFGPGHLNLKKVYAHSAIGDKAVYLDPMGTTFVFDFDQNRRMYQEWFPLGGKVQYGFDSEGHQVSVARISSNPIDPSSIEQTPYRPDGKVDKVMRADGTWTQYTYDPVGRKASETSSSGRKVLFSYDAASRLIATTDTVASTLDPSITRNLGPVTRETRSYYLTGDLATVTDSNGATMTYAYDGFLRNAEVDYPDLSYELHARDVADNEIVMQRRSGAQIWNTYDNLNRLVLKEPDGQASTTYRYDLSGRQLSASAAGIPSITYSYDGAGRIVGEGRSDIGNSTWILDPNDHRISLSWPGVPTFSTSYVYDAAGRYTTISDPSGPVATFTYDGMSRRVGTTYGQSSATTATDWHQNGRPSHIAHHWSGGGVDLAYGFNTEQRLMSVGSSDPAFLWMPTTPSSSAYQVNALNQYLAINGNPRSYDLDGNLTFDGTWNFGYDTEGHLISATKPGTSVSYGYDAAGRRSSETVNGQVTYFLSVGNEEIGDYDGTRQVVRRYISRPEVDTPVASVSPSGAHAFHLLDGQGSVAALVDDAGGLIETHAYSPYGRSPGTSSTPFLFAARRFDAATGLYHNRARAYSPELGRFLQTDPAGIKGGLNLYAYVQNDPMNAVDPSGLVNIYIGGAGDATSGIVRDFVRDLHDPNSHYYSHSDAAAIQAFINSQPASEPINLIGHSWGGNVAANIAESSPRRIDMLITVDPVGVNRPDLNAVRNNATTWIDVNAATASPWTLANVVAGVGGAYNDAPKPYADVFINASANHEQFNEMMGAFGNGYHSPKYMLGINK
jgi:RHS repeat-associated protein